MNFTSSSSSFSSLTYIGQQRDASNGRMRQNKIAWAAESMNALYALDEEEKKKELLGRRWMDAATASTSRLIDKNQSQSRTLLGQLIEFNWRIYVFR